MPMGLNCQIYVLTLCWLFVYSALAGPTNRTIDDTFGDFITGDRPTYASSESQWSQNGTSGLTIASQINQGPHALLART